MLPWREASRLGLSYLMVITSARRRVHHRSGCTSTGSSFTWRKPVLTGSVERQHRRAHSYGGISSLGQRGRRVLHFSGERNKGRGHT
jgi:hypothetical protein